MGPLSPQEVLVSQGISYVLEMSPHKVPKFQYFLNFLKYLYSFNLFLARRAIPASTDRNVFLSTSTFPDESTPFLFPEEVVTGTEQGIYFNAGRHQHSCLESSFFHSALCQDGNAKLHLNY